MISSTATPILQFQFSKASRKWSQILFQYLRRNVQSVRATWFASQDSLTFCIQTKNKITKAILTIPSSIIPSYQLNTSKANFQLKSTKGYICSIKPVNMESFLVSTDNSVTVTIDPLKFKISHNHSEGVNTFSSKLLQLAQDTNPFQQLEGDYQCQISVSHTNNSILQSIYSISHNFKCRQVHVNFDDLNNHLILKFISSQSNQPIQISTKIVANNKHLKRPRVYNAKMFATGMMGLEKCDGMDLCFANNVIVFVSRWREGFCYRYYLAEMENMGDD